MISIIRRFRLPLYLGLGLALGLGACAGVPAPDGPPPDGSGPAEASPAASQPDGDGARAGAFAFLPGWEKDRQSEALRAFLKSCAVLLQKPANSAIGPGGIGGRPGDWREPCGKAANLAAEGADDRKARQFFETDFRPVLTPGMKEGPGFFTGYYEAEFAASRFPDAQFRYPLYRAPQPATHLTRAEIEAGALRGQGLELVFLADPVDRFFLQVQGSGRLRLAEGGIMRVGYGGNNGHPFVAIGKLMLEAGIIPRNQASAQGVAAWLKAHPAEAKGWMNRNPRYIFFRTVTGEGPIGAMGIPLTPRRSLAVDPAFVPLGIPIWIDTSWPIDNPEGRRGEPLRRLMLAQDTGAAIKGAVRGDFFWGTGEAALNFAGPMRSEGRWVFILPVAIVERAKGRLQILTGPAS